MIIAIPSDSDDFEKADIAQHFGRCYYYILLDSEGNHVKTIRNTSEHMGGKGLPPELLKENEVDILICREMGPRAVNLCKELGIKPFICSSDNVKDAFREWAGGGMKKADPQDSCEVHKQ